MQLNLVLNDYLLFHSRHKTFEQLCIYVKVFAVFVRLWILTTTGTVYPDVWFEEGLSDGGTHCIVSLLNFVMLQFSSPVFTLTSDCEAARPILSP